MKKPALRNALYSTMLVAALSLASCGKKTDTEVDSDTTTTTTTTETGEDYDETLRDTVVTSTDTVIEMGGGDNPNPTEEQVP